jgi:hypothetical protein
MRKYYFIAWIDEALLYHSTANSEAIWAATPLPCSGNEDNTGALLSHSAVG